MKYLDLISRDTCVKLTMVSFAKPEKNLQVFRFAKALEPLHEYIANEHNKLVQKYGRADDNGNWSVSHPKSQKLFGEEMQVLLNQDVQDLFPALNLTPNDFEESNCSYPVDKSLWLNAYELKAIFNMLEKIKERNGKQNV